MPLPRSPRQSGIVPREPRDADDTRIVPWESLMRLTKDERDASASTIHLARLRAVRELYAAGDAKGALAIASLLGEDLCFEDDDVTVEVVGEDEVELILSTPAEPRGAAILPSRIVMVVPR